MLPLGQNDARAWTGEGKTEHFCLVCENDHLQLGNDLA
jgi:hypothetical protein